jgi:NitT/TauT family transport system substrate-binding protein
VQTDASNVTAALLNGSADIAALPTNAAANIYNKSEGGVVVLAVNTLGCLYLLTNQNATVTSFEDLRGKTVYVPAQNPTFIFTYLCKQNGLKIGEDVTIDSTTYAQPAALKDAVAAGLVDVAVLPEPMVTIAINTAKNADNGTVITNAMDLTAEWNKVSPEGSLVQGCIVVRREFLENHPEAVENFLKEYKASIEYLSTDIDSASQMIVDNGIFTNAGVAKKALPNCNVCYLDGAQMKSAMQTYLSVIFGIAPASVGGKLPADAFYYTK